MALYWLVWQGCRIMTIDASWIAIGVSILGFLGMMAATLGTRTPKDIILDHEGRLREIEEELHGSGPLWQERHNRHEKSLETLTVALNALGEKIDMFSNKIELVERRIDAVVARSGG